MLATGVGTDPEAVPFMGGAHAGCSQHSPSRIEPQLGQVPKNSGESGPPENKQPCAVLHFNSTGSNFANDASHLAPQPGSLAVKAVSVLGLAVGIGDAGVLAREASSHHVNNAAPWSAVKGPHVIPNRERRECSVVLSGHQD
jgi:hypothetical protein